VWNADGLLGNLTKLALLTGQRIDKIYSMRWDDIKDGVWTIRTGEREKGNAGSLRLPQMALDILEQCRSGSSYVVDQTSIVSRAERYRKVFARTHGMANWTYHDLRRTARSLMAASGVPILHAELVMGHTQKGVIGVYDRHQYADEKAEALEMLASRIRDIVTPPPSNVTPLRTNVA
jgi:integrase